MELKNFVDLNKVKNLWLAQSPKTAPLMKMQTTIY